MPTALWVAILAAVVSTIAAVIAAMESRRARAAAETINSRNHQIAVIDRDADELRSGFASFVSAFASKEPLRPEWGISVLVAGELAMACRGADSEYRARVTALTTLAAGGIETMALQSIDARFDELRQSYLARQNALEARRQALLDSGRGERNGPSEESVL